MKRLFRRGQDEEATVISDLRRIGLIVVDTGTNQRKVQLSGFVKGNVDGVITNYKDKPHILEIKTHNQKSFDALLKEGIPEKHQIQMQLYMKGTGIDRGLYFAVNKNTDEIYTERVKLDEKKAQKYIDRGTRLTLSDNIPPPISENPSWYQCKFCSAHEFCHKTKLTKNVNCRTCARVTFKEDGTVFCEKWKAEIKEEHQRVGCRSHVLHPDLVPWEMKEVDEDNVEYNGVVNGESGVDSRELVVDGFFEDSVQMARKVLGATILPEKDN